MNARTAIFVLGMHRSGTSALTRMLNFLGASLPRRLHPPGIGNDTGHWEPEAGVRLHDRLLDAVAAERYTRDTARSFCLYSGLLEDWRAVARQLARDLDLSWPRSPVEAERDIESFLFAQLRRHHESDDIGARPGIWSSWIAPVFATLRNAGTGHEPDRVVFDAVGRSFENACMGVRSVSLPEDSDGPLPDASFAAPAHDRPAGQKMLCLVGTAFWMSNGGAEHLRDIIEDAVNADFNVTIVNVGALPGPAAAALDALAVSHGLDVQYCQPCAPTVEPAFLRSTIGLFRHLRARNFDAILFQDDEGLGYASIVAKQAGLAFAETALGVVAFGSSRWRREYNHQFPASLVTIATEYLEQRAVELADVVILPSQQIAQWMERAGWRLGTALPLPEIAETTPSEDNVWAGILQQVRPEKYRPAEARSEGMRPNDVTVVIAHFEQPGLLDQTLEALTHQTDINFSVVVVDDGSQSADASRYLDSIEEQYRTLNLRLLRQENRYLGAARNAGIRAANTDFVILLDHDNVAFPDMVRTLRRAIRMAEADVVTCGIRHFHDATGRPRFDTDCSGPEQFFSAGPVLLGAVHNCFGDASGIYRKAVFDAVGYFHELHGVAFEDWQMHLRIVAAGFRLLSLPEPLVWYRVRPNSMLRTTRRYDNARVIAATINEMPCSMLEPLADYLMGSEAEQVRLNGEMTRLAADAHSEVQAIRAVAAANRAALLEAKAEACRHARSLQEVLEERTKSARNAEQYARSLEDTLAELRASHNAATEYAVGLERSRDEIETYAKHLETEYRKIIEGR